MGLHEHFGQLETRIRRALDYDDSIAPTTGQAILWVPDGGGGGKFTPRTITPSGIGAAAASHAHAAGDVTSGTMAAARLPIGTASGTVAAGNDSRIAGAEQSANKDQANGYPGLDSNGRIDPADMPLVPSPVRSGATSSSVTSDASSGAGNLINLTLTGNATINLSTPADHQRITYHLTASGADRTVTFGSSIFEPPGVPSSYLIPQSTVLIVELEYIGNRGAGAAWMVTRVQPSDLHALGQTLYGEQASDLGVTNSATLTNTGIAIPVQAGATYVIDGHLRYGSTTAADAKFALAGPSMTAVQWSVHGLDTGATSGAGSLLSNVALAIGTALAVGGTGGTAGVARPKGVLKPAASGTVTLQFAQNTATSGVTSTLYAPSHLTLQRVA